VNGITADMLGILSAPTPPDEIKQRQGPGGRQLDYVDARFVMDRLDEIGAENWQDQYVDRTNGSVRCGIGVLVEGEWIWKWDVGTESDIESDKGSYSDAFKRAAVKWGIGRDLYGHATTNAGRQSPPSRPAAPTPRPVSVSAPGGVPEEPDYLREALGGSAGPTETPVPSGDASQCPAHHKPWTNGKYGWYCTSKAAPGFKANTRGYCDEKPNPRWAAMQEVAS